MTVILQCHFNNDVFFIGMSCSFYKQVQHGDDLFTWRCAHCSIPNIHDESQLIDPDAENTRLPTEISPSRYLRDIGINASLVLTPHQHVIDISTLNITSITGCTYHWAQGVWCKTRKLGLQPSYMEHNGTYSYLCKLYALPFVPSEHFQDAFTKLQEKAPRDEIRSFCDYVKST